mmetsp:Transcript_109548/g.275580  ORF Transcript_109548/g.275580 Transcript_109548/m.275580 type:complete len:348 (+) Transcript_109548:481-1524(+)
MACRHSTQCSKFLKLLSGCLAEDLKIVIALRHKGITVLVQLRIAKPIQEVLVQVLRIARGHNERRRCRWRRCRCRCRWHHRSRLHGWCCRGDGLRLRGRWDLCKWRRGGLQGLIVFTDVQFGSIFPHNLGLQSNLGGDPFEWKHSEGLLDLNAYILDAKKPEGEKLLDEHHSVSELVFQRQGEQKEPQEQEAGQVFRVAERNWRRKDVLASTQVVNQAGDVVLHEEALLLRDAESGHLRPQPVQNKVRCVHAGGPLQDLIDLCVGKADAIAAGTLCRPRRGPQLGREVVGSRVAQVAHQRQRECWHPPREVDAVLLPHRPQASLLREVTANVEDAAPLVACGDVTII